MIISAIPLIVHIKVTLVSTCCLLPLASTVSDSESNDVDDAFILTARKLHDLSESMNGCKIKPIPNTDMVYLHKVLSIHKYIDSDCLYVTTLTCRCTQFIDITFRFTQFLDIIAIGFSRRWANRCRRWAIRQWAKRRATVPQMRRRETPHDGCPHCCVCTD